MAIVKTLGRRALTAAWLGLLGGLMTLVLAIQVAPHLGGQVFVIRGASMTPSIPLGALALVDTRARTPAAGDVVTVKAPNGVHVTHRVVRIVDDPSGPLMELRGDANARSDAALVPVAATVGTLRGHVPVAGYLVALLSAPTGLIAILSAAGCLLLAKWVLEESEDAGGSTLVPRETIGEAAA